MSFIKDLLAKPVNLSNCVQSSANERLSSTSRLDCYSLFGRA